MITAPAALQNTSLAKLNFAAIRRTVSKSRIMPANPSPAPRTLRMSLWRALRLRCPLCGTGPLFRTWLRMHANCSNCNLRFDRAPGYYLGSVYINYGLTALLVTFAYFAMFFTDTFSPSRQLMVLGGFCVIFPLWFFRYARSLWLTMDLYFDPRQLDGETIGRNTPTDGP